MEKRRIDAYGISVGRMPKGARNKITDVPGVRVGHCTIDTERYKTGVTLVLPGTRNPFMQKPVAASHVLNGFSKALGLVQIEELGTLETPIALTGTLNVGLVHDALLQLTLEENGDRDSRPTSINPVVLECNDSRLSDIAGRPVRIEHVRAAMEDASEDFEEGSVGAGLGMICHGLKGGIGSASRRISLGDETYTLGLLVMTNHGKLEDFLISGRIAGEAYLRRQLAKEVAERGSISIVLATDLPLDDRQLRRVLRRTPVGLHRLGSYIGHGSGEVMVGFTTANHMLNEEEGDVLTRRVLREDRLDEAFRAAAECCEEAVLNAMICADTTVGYRGDTVYSLKDILKKEI